MWLWGCLQLALARPDAAVAVRVTDPSGQVAFDGEIDVGAKQALTYTGGGPSRRVWSLDLRSSLQREGAVIDAVLTERTETSSKVRAEARIAGVEGEVERVELGWKKLEGAWAVETSWARTFLPAGQGPLPGGKAKYALVWDDAQLLGTPRAPDAFSVRRELPEGRTDASAQASPYKVIHAWADSHLEVEPAEDADRLHCGADGTPPPPPLSSGSGAPRYVAVTDVVPLVSTGEVSGSFEDGTGYSVAAGVSFVPLEDGGYEVAAGALRFVVAEVDPSLLGVRYLPSAHWPVVEDGWTVQPSPDGVVGMLGGREVRWVGEERPVLQGRAGVREPLVILRDACAEVRIRTGVEALVRPE